MAQQLLDKFVIIAGVGKCGSTSLFAYLNDHPKILGAIVKEPNYFLYPEPILTRRYQSKWESKYLTSPLEDYYKVFPPVENKEDYRLDGSVKYWYASETAETIYRYLPNAKLIFIFRNPIDRFISMYRYQRQMHSIPASITLEQYLNGYEGYENIGKRALQFGKYAERLKPYWERFDHDNILLLGFSELKNNPQDLMKKVCKFLNIDDEIYTEYDFEHHNKTQGIRNMRLDRLQHNVIMPIYRKIVIYPRLFQFVKAVNRRTWYPFYQFLNGKSFDKSEISDEVKHYLNDYYKDEARLLYELTGLDGLLN